MRIWILTQYYPPETGAAAIRLSRLARLLAADGHQITVLTGMPNYPDGVIEAPYRGNVTYRETIDGVDVRRVWVYASPNKRARSRLLNQFSFMMMTALRGMWLRRPDVILVESHPLFVTLSAGWLRRIKRAPIVLNVSDLWPESAVATGVLRADSQMVKIASRIERWAYHDAAHIVGMSQGIVDGINQVLSKPNCVTLIRNGVDLQQFRPASNEERLAARDKLGIQPQRFVAVHIGNQSLTYDFDLILGAAARLPEVLFLFAGGGSQAEYIRNKVQNSALHNVWLLGVLPHMAIPTVWAVADISLLAMRNHSVAGTTIPAKVYESLATGTPLVAAIRGEAATLINNASAGIVVPIGDIEGYAAAISDLATSGNKKTALSQAGRDYGERTLSPYAVKDTYFSIMAKVAEKL
jgi:glycosyltransferase involved in cell wall biosynthesis